MKVAAEILHDGSPNVWELRCIGLAKCGGCNVWELWCVGIAVPGGLRICYATVKGVGHYGKSILFLIGQKLAFSTLRQALILFWLTLGLQTPLQR